MVAFDYPFREYRSGDGKRGDVMIIFSASLVEGGYLARGHEFSLFNIQN